MKRYVLAKAEEDSLGDRHAHKLTLGDVTYAESVYLVGITCTLGVYGLRTICLDSVCAFIKGRGHYEIKVPLI